MKKIYYFSIYTSSIIVMPEMAHVTQVIQCIYKAKCRSIYRWPKSKSIDLRQIGPLIVICMSQPKLWSEFAGQVLTKIQVDSWVDSNFEKWPTNNLNLKNVTGWLVFYRYLDLVWQSKWLEIDILWKYEHLELIIL